MRNQFGGSRVEDASGGREVRGRQRALGPSGTRGIQLSGLGKTLFHAAVVTGVTMAFVQPASGQAAEPPVACSASAYRQFDFWVGEWEVTDPNGTVVGSNAIRRILNGCVLHENWKGASGSGGQSHNLYNMQTERWHQTWVDDTGTLLQLDGGLDEAGRMVLRGETVGSNAEPVLNEISWEALDDGRVRQVWRTSTDSGSTWRIVFDGLYERKR